MILKTKLFGKVYAFKSLNEVMAKANEEKSGDRLAGLAAESSEERVAAKVVLSNITLEDLRNNPAVPYEIDEVTRIIQDDVNEKIYSEIKHWTVSEFREWILDENTTGADIRRISRGLTSEMVAAVAKLMSNMDLIYGARKIKVTAHCNTTMVEYGKPSPDIYEYACRQLKLLPEECMAVEDSPNGVLSAYRAGCKVVMVPDQTEPEEALKEILYGCVENLLEIRKYF